MNAFCRFRGYGFLNSIPSNQNCSCDIPSRLRIPPMCYFDYYTKTFWVIRMLNCHSQQTIRTFLCDYFAITNFQYRESRRLKPPTKSGCLHIASHIQSASLSRTRPAYILLTLKRYSIRLEDHIHPLQF